MSNKLIEVQDLNVRFDTPEGVVTAVNGLSFALERGQTFGIVGESGSGKSQSMMAMMGLLAANGRASGKALVNGEDLLTMPAAKLNKIRGNRVAMIFQDPMTSLNPYLTVERQMTEVLELHKGLTRKSALSLAIQTLEQVRIPDAARRIRMYPHEFSGGMRQRIMIAMALLCPPNMARLPPGCPFTERCPFVMDICATNRPPLEPAVNDPMVLRACHRPVADIARDAETV